MSFKKAGKQIDKFSQWTGEKLFKEEKTHHSHAFQDLESEVELKRKGIERLFQTSASYLKTLSRKEKIEDLELQTDGSKVLPVEYLGLTMVHFGSELGSGNDYGQCLVGIGRAQCKIAVAQERFSEDLAEGFMGGLERTMGEMKEYSAARKKLESRRLTMDAAQKRLMTSKKTNPLLEEEVRVAKARFEETQEDVQMRMESISQNEDVYFQELKGFLDDQLSYINQQRTILEEVQENLGLFSSGSDSPVPSGPSPIQSRKPSASALRAAQFEEPVFNPSTATGHTDNRARSNSTQTDKEKEKKSIFGALRKRSIGAGSNGSNTDRAGLSGAGGGGRKSWGALNGEDEDEFETARREEDFRGVINFPGRKPSLGQRSMTMGPSSAAEVGWEKIFRAKFEFKSVDKDELELRVGDVVTVTEEVSADWWKGTLPSGKSGLFPSAYTEPLPLIRKTNGSAPPLPSIQRPVGTGRSLTQPSLSTEVTDQDTRDTRTSFQYSDDDRPSFTRRSSSDSDSYDDQAGLTSTSPFRPTSSLALSRLGTGIRGGKKAPPPPPPTSAPRRGTVSTGSRGSVGFAGRPSSKSVGAEDQKNPFFDPN